MKTISITICFIIWALMTLILALSLVGIIVLAREDWSCQQFQGEEGESNWMRIGKELINKLIE